MTSSVGRLLLRGDPVSDVAVENIERQRAGIQDQIMKLPDVEPGAELRLGSLAKF